MGRWLKTCVFNTRSILPPRSLSRRYTHSQHTAKLTTSTVYLGAISARHCRANGVNGAAATTMALATPSPRMRSANVLMTLTPTLGSSG